MNAYLERFLQGGLRGLPGQLEFQYVPVLIYSHDVSIAFQHWRPGGRKKQDQPWASGLQLLAPLLGFCLGSKGWRQQNMGKQPNNQNWVSKGDVSPCINWFTINFSPFSDVSPRFFSLLDGLLGINDLPHFFCCRELGPGETYDLCSIMYNTLYIYIYCNTCIIYIDFDIIQVYIYIRLCQKCMWRFVKMSVPGFVDKSQFHARRLMFAFKKHDLPWWRENVEVLRYLWKSF